MLFISSSVNVTFAHPSKLWRFRKRKAKNAEGADDAEDAEAGESEFEEAGEADDAVEEVLPAPPSALHRELSEAALRRIVGKDGRGWGVLASSDVYIGVDGGLLGATLVVASSVTRHQGEVSQNLHSCSAGTVLLITSHLCFAERERKREHDVLLFSAPQLLPRCCSAQSGAPHGFPKCS